MFFSAVAFYQPSTSMNKITKAGIWFDATVYVIGFDSARNLRYTTISNALKSFWGKYISTVKLDQFHWANLFSGRKYTFFNESIQMNASELY